MKLRMALSKESNELLDSINALYASIFDSDDLIHVAEIKTRKFVTPEHRIRKSSVQTDG